MVGGLQTSPAVYVGSTPLPKRRRGWSYFQPKKILSGPDRCSARSTVIAGIVTAMQAQARHVFPKQPHMLGHANARREAGSLPVSRKYRIKREHATKSPPRATCASIEGMQST